MKTPVPAGVEVAYMAAVLVIATISLCSLTVGLFIGDYRGTSLMIHPPLLGAP